MSSAALHRITDAARELLLPGPSIVGEYSACLAQVATALDVASELRCTFGKLDARVFEDTSVATHVQAVHNDLAIDLLGLALRLPQEAPIATLRATAEVLRCTLRVAVNDSAEISRGEAAAVDAADHLAAAQALDSASAYLDGSVSVVQAAEPVARAAGGGGLGDATMPMSMSMRGRKAEHGAVATALTVAALVAAASLLADNHFTRVLELAGTRVRAGGVSARVAEAARAFAAVAVNSTSAAPMGLLPGDAGARNRPKGPDATHMVAGMLLADPLATRAFADGITGEQIAMLRQSLDRDVFERLLVQVQGGQPSATAHDDSRDERVGVDRAREALTAIGRALLEPVADERWLGSLSPEQRNAFAELAPEVAWRLLGAGVGHAGFGGGFGGGGGGGGSGGGGGGGGGEQSSLLNMLLGSSLGVDRLAEMTGADVVDILRNAADAQVTQLASVVARAPTAVRARLVEEASALQVPLTERARIQGVLGPAPLPQQFLSTPYRQETFLGRSASRRRTARVAARAALPCLTDLGAGPFTAEQSIALLWLHRTKQRHPLDDSASPDTAVVGVLVGLFNTGVVSALLQRGFDLPEWQRRATRK
jgi:hypothetical protein